MAGVIETLRREHRNSARLLDALEHQTDIVEIAAAPDYELLRGIADYFCDYPDRCHHPKENVIFAQLRANHPEQAATVGDLAKEHLEARARAQRIRDNINALFRDAILPRDTFVSAARNFIEAERQHMRMEEEHFFPLSEKILTPGDWKSIEARLQNEHDPLFGGRVEGEFKVLRDRLLAWESADRQDAPA